LCILNIETAEHLGNKVSPVRSNYCSFVSLAAKAECCTNCYKQAV